MAQALEDEFGNACSESESGRRRRFLEIAQQLTNGAGRWRTAAAALVRSESAGPGDVQRLAHVLRAQDSELTACYRDGQSHLAHVSKGPVTALAARAGGVGAEPHATFNASAERTQAAAQAVQGLVDVWGAGEPLLVQHQGAKAAAQHTASDQHEQQLGHAEPLAIYGSLVAAGVDCRDRAAKIEAGRPVDPLDVVLVVSRPACSSCNIAIPHLAKRLNLKVTVAQGNANAQTGCVPIVETYRHAAA